MLWPGGSLDGSFASLGSRGGPRPARGFSTRARADRGVRVRISPDEAVPGESGGGAPSIQALPAHYRAVLILRDIEELPNEEIAEAVGDTVAWVKSRLHRARMALREIPPARSHRERRTGPTPKNRRLL